jgi:EAL domain-containing protein (putative c-di-GMP-specific phosphodiesterase class I)
MVHHARTSDSHLVAEGVETEAEAEVLTRLGVELAQGFLFAIPAPIEEVVGECRAA